MIEVKIVPPVPAEGTVSIVGLTMGEYQVIRNALYSYGNLGTSSCKDLVCKNGKTQSEVASDLHDVIYML